MKPQKLLKDWRTWETLDGKEVTPAGRKKKPCGREKMLNEKRQG